MWVMLFIVFVSADWRDFVKARKDHVPFGDDHRAYVHGDSENLLYDSRLEKIRDHVEDTLFYLGEVYLNLEKFPSLRCQRDQSIVYTIFALQHAIMTHERFM